MEGRIVVFYGRKIKIKGKLIDEGKGGGTMLRIV